ncbi:MAG: hypothetical protein QXX19_02890 [Candidatus Caldarchaeum sp.]
MRERAYMFSWAAYRRRPIRLVEELAELEQLGSSTTTKTLRRLRWSTMPIEKKAGLARFYISSAKRRLPCLRNYLNTANHVRSDVDILVVLTHAPSLDMKAR